MKNGIFKSVLLFLIGLVGGHIAESLLFGIALNSIVSGIWRDGYYSKAALTVAVYVFISHVIFCIVYTVIFTRSVEFRDGMKARIREGESAFAICKATYLKNLAFELPVYIVFMIPFTVYFSLLTNIDLSNSFSFEKFHISEMGMYIACNNAFLGLVAVIPAFFLILFAVRLAVIAILRKNMIENSVTLQ